jgi:hypothetical protein
MDRDTVISLSLMGSGVKVSKTSGRLGAGLCTVMAALAAAMVTRCFPKSLRQTV